MARTIKNPGIFAADAQTTIPPTPVVGIPYRNAATGLDEIRNGWPFKTIVDSADFAQILHELTSLTDLIDRTGVLEYKDDILYDLVPAYAQGTDGLLYVSEIANGPATGAGVVDPVGDVSGTWELFSSPTADLALVTANSAAADATEALGLAQVAAASSSPTNSTEVLATVPGMSGISIVSGKIYEITIAVGFLAHLVGESIDFRIEFSGGSNVGSILLASVDDSSGTSNAWEKKVFIDVTFTPVLVVANSIMLIKGTWKAPSSGDLSFQFAKGGATAGNAQVFDSSVMIVTEVG